MAAKIAATEPEDAGVTGGTRSLMRRMLGLNFARTAVPRPVMRSGRPQVA